MPSTLESVRITRGFTQSALSTASGISQGAISLIETGHQQPSQRVRAALASALNVPAPLLEASAPTVHLRHEAKGSVPAKAIKRVTAEFALAFLRVGLLVGDIRHDVAHRSLERALASDRAIELRRKWRVSSGAVDDVIRLLEEHGVFCLRRDLSGIRAKAIAATSEDRRALMFVDPRADADVVRWAVAHELGHLVMHESSGAANETSADEFAGEFLAPRSELRARREAGADVDDLIHEYRVPPAEFARLAQRGRLVTVAEYRRLRRTSPEAGSLLPGPTRLAEALSRDPRVLGESIDERAASAFLTPETLQRDYLIGSRS